MKKIFIVLAIITFAVSAFAVEIAGVTLPETISASDDSLVLNGVGLRKKFIIKVYASALYLKEKETNEETILNADEPMIIRMVMLYEGVSPEKLRKTWIEGFEANTEDISPLQERIDTLTSWFTTETKKGDTYELLYVPEKGTRLSINNSVKGIIEGLDFKKALFSIWLGEEPADNKLKEHLLSKD